jgi:hypothetical protein
MGIGRGLGDGFDLVENGRAIHLDDAMITTIRFGLSAVPRETTGRLSLLTVPILSTSPPPFPPFTPSASNVRVNDFWFMALVYSK